MPLFKRFGLKLMGLAVLAAAIVTAVIVGGGFLEAGKTIFDLLSENRELKRAISNLTAESQIGVAKVLSQGEEDGRLVTRLLFVETARDDPHKRILQKEYAIEGDVVHFDALIVKFSDEYVMDGKGRALYLWRRVYGETMPPEDGYPIEEKGVAPKRYADLLARLPVKDRNLFWSEIWSLSDDPERLAAAGIKAIYGNVIYKRLQPGRLYLFRIKDTGELYPDSVPDL